MQVFWDHVEQPVDSRRGSLLSSPTVASVELQLGNEGGKAVLAALAVLLALMPPRWETYSWSVCLAVFLV